MFKLHICFFALRLTIIVEHMAMQRSSQGPDPWDECCCSPTSVEPNDLWQRWLWSQETSAALLGKAVVTAQSCLIRTAEPSSDLQTKVHSEMQRVASTGLLLSACSSAWKQSNPGYISVVFCTILGQWNKGKQDCFQNGHVFLHF